MTSLDGLRKKCPMGFSQGGTKRIERNRQRVRNRQRERNRKRERNRQRERNREKENRGEKIRDR